MNRLALSTACDAATTSARVELAKWEQRVELALQPKPRLCPKWLWRKIIARVVRLDIHMPHRIA